MIIVKPFNQKRTATYKYIERENHLYNSNKVRGYTYSSSFIDIKPNGDITVKANEIYPYAWDGCSPKFKFLGLWLWGIPDGALDIMTGKSATYYASMFHDALYQHLGTKGFPLTRKECDIIFGEILGSYSLAGTYYTFVRIFGGIH